MKMTPFIMGSKREEHQEYYSPAKFHSSGRRLPHTGLSFKAILECSCFYEEGYGCVSR